MESKREILFPAASSDALALRLPDRYNGRESEVALGTGGSNLDPVLTGSSKSLIALRMESGFEGCAGGPICNQGTQETLEGIRVLGTPLCTPRD